MPRHYFSSAATVMECCSSVAQNNDDFKTNFLIKPRLNWCIAMHQFQANLIILKITNWWKNWRTICFHARSMTATVHISFQIDKLIERAVRRLPAILRQSRCLEHLASTSISALGHERTSYCEQPSAGSSHRKTSSGEVQPKNWCSRSHCRYRWKRSSAIRQISSIDRRQLSVRRFLNLEPKLVAAHHATLTTNWWWSQKVIGYSVLKFRTSDDSLAKTKSEN